MGSAEDYVKLAESLADVCRAKGIGRIRMSDSRIEGGPFVELEMGAPPPAPPRTLTEEEKAASAKELRRTKYKRALGRDVSDEELELLP